MKIRRILCTAMASVMVLSAAIACTTLSASAAVPTYISTAQPKTNIAGELAVIRPIDSADELNEVATAQSKPAVAIYSVDKDLNVLDGKGAAFSTVDKVLEKTGYTIIPAFTVSSSTVAKNVANHMKSIGLSDCIFVSPSAVNINAARKILPEATGILDYTATFRDKTALSEDECLEIRRTVKSKNVTAIMLPAALCSQETVQYLYERQVNVWARTSDTPTTVEQYDAILSGAIGVVSDATDAYLDIACNKLPAGTMTRTPINIAHRGLPRFAPENTVEGAIEAYNRGAQAIELDFYLSSDGHAVAMHNAFTGATCDRDVAVESTPLARLKQLYVNKGYENHETFSQCRIPTIEEFFEYFKDKDCRFYIEIKSKNPAIVPVIRDAIEQYGMYGQCTVITFDADMMQAFRDQYPDMALGALCGDFMGGTDPEADLRAAMAYAGPYNATLHPSYSINGTVYYKEDDVRAANFRGVSINPWTFGTSIATYSDYFLWGYTGLTGDGASSLGRLPLRVAYTPASTEVAVGDSLPLTLEVDTYARKTSTKDATVTIVEGEECATLTDNVLTFTAEGEVTVLLSYSYSIAGAGSYVLFERPMTFTANPEPDFNPGPETVPDTEPETGAPVEDGTTDSGESTPESTPDDRETSKVDGTEDADDKDDLDEDDMDTDDSGCGSTVALIPTLLLLTAAVGALLLIRRRDEA